LSPGWQTSAAGDADAGHEIYAGEAICDYPQSGERILGEAILQALRVINYQGRQACTVSIMEFRNGKAVHETQYFASMAEAMGSADRVTPH